MRKCALFLATALVLCGAATNAFAGMVLTRDIPGLDAGGYFVPGTSTLDITLTLTEDEAAAITALGVKEALPAGMSFDSVLSNPAPQLAPANGATGTIEFAYFSIPAFPLTITYRVNIGGGFTPSPTTWLRGWTEYRTGGPALFSNNGVCGNAAPPNPEPLPAPPAEGCETNSVLELEPTTVSVARDIDPASTAISPLGAAFYVPGGAYDVTITFTKSGAEGITALGFRDTLPAGWSFSTLGGANQPQLAPSNGATGTIEFAWFSIPAFPASFTYQINVPGGASGTATTSGTAEYRLGGPAIFSNTVEFTADPEPCLTFSRPEPPNEPFYVAGSTKTITVEIDGSSCGGVTALGLRETLPAGWAYAGGLAGANQPQLAPSNGATGIIEFAWFSIPAFPATFSYDVTLDGGLSGDQVLSGQAEYRLGGPALFSPVTSNTYVGDGPPVITLVGADPVTVECGGSYTDDGATAFDVPDGDITPSIVVGGLPIDTTTPGTYTVTYDVTDSTANAATQVTRTVNVQDTAAPVITLNGAGTLTIECGSAYTDAGASASDACDGDLTGAISVSGVVDPTTPGVYTLTFDVSDGAGNPASSVTRDVTVADTTAPVISVNGAATLTLECGAVYSEAGASAADVCDGALAVVIGGDPVDTANPGTYVVTYDVTDAAGNPAIQRTRTVTVSDTIDPVVTLNGGAAVTVECGGNYVEDGASATDSCDGALSVNIGGDTVNEATPGTYLVTYSATDGAGNTGSATRTVTVEDTTDPVLSLLGNPIETVECGSTYTDANGMASDTCDSSVTVSNNAATAVDTATPGTYTVTVAATDDSGNFDTQTRTVNVVDSTAPVIALNGAAAVTVACGSNFTDEGATASDACDTGVAVVAGGSVDTTTPGVYTLTYDATDASGNAATQAVRTVTVSDTTAPVISLNGAAAVTVECGGSFSDDGATASDACDASVAVVTAGSVDTATPGVYTLTYDATDASGNAATQVVRTVTVSDTTDPVVTLNGAATQTIECGGAYTEEGATASDTCDSDTPVTTSGSVNTAVPGVYTVTYSATDDAGNTGSATRTVTVSDTAGPVVTLNGDAATSIDCNTSFTDPGASANDTCSGALAVATTGSVNGAVPGVYTLTYTATDAAGNVGTATRTVTVLDNCTIPCSITSVTVTSPDGDLVTSPGTTNVTVSLRSMVTIDGEDCEGQTIEVVYDVNGVVVGTSSDAASDYLLQTNLAPGEYDVTATATLSNGATGVGTSTFNILVGPDIDNNGICDNPFGDECLPEDGVEWVAVVPGVNCDREVRMISWTGDGLGGFISVAANNPAGGNTARVNIPRNVLAVGERGVIILSIACDLPSLLGQAAADAIGDPTADLTQDAAFFDLTILVSADDGATFAELDNSILEDLPITVILTGLAFNPTLAPNFQSHGTDASTTTPVVIGEGAGPWSSDSVAGAVGSGGVLSGQTTSLSVFAPVETSPLGPTLSVEPNPAYDVLFGIVKLGETAQATVTLRNIGTGTVSGNATIADPAGVFGVVGTSTYSLAAGASATLTLSFTPDEEGDFTGSISLSGAVNSPVTLTVKGTGSDKVKRFALFGCAPGAGSAGNGFGDAAVILLALAGLTLGSQAVRRARRAN